MRLQNPGADPVLWFWPERGGGAESTICSKFPENCMILKKSCEQGGLGPQVPWILWWNPLVEFHLCNSQLFTALSTGRGSKVLGTPSFSTSRTCLSSHCCFVGANKARLTDCSSRQVDHFIVSRVTLCTETHKVNTTRTRSWHWEVKPGVRAQTTMEMLEMKIGVLKQEWAPAENWKKHSTHKGYRSASIAFQCTDKELRL